jgi:hypothetical protein
MGIVFQARQVSLNRLVAVKMIRSGELASEGDRQRFQVEAEAVAGLDHPHIVPIYEHGEHQGRPYFSMKLIAGGSLEKRLSASVADPRAAARLMVTVARALHHAHQRGILHRDLKPANILIDADGQPHVTDFGLAKRIEADSDLTASGAFVGTPSFMAPEQASGRTGSITTATDVHGLGAILYALLTGRPPFKGESVLETLEQVRERAPEPPSRINSRVARDLEVICLACLNKEPRRRYESAAALAQDLENWLAGKPIGRKPVSVAARAWMWCRRNPALATSMGLAAAALVAVVGLSISTAAQQTRAAAAQFQAAERLRAEQQQTKAALRKAGQLAADLALDRGIALAEQGDAGRGLLWMARALMSAPTDDAASQYAIRANISAWVRQVGRLEDCLDIAPARFHISPDGKTIVTVSGASARLWSAADRTPIGPPMVHLSVIRALAFSPDGKAIVTGSGAGARLWSAADGTPIGPPMTHQALVLAVALSPGGKTVVTASNDKTVRLWSAADGTPMGKPVTHHHEVLAVALSPDGKTIVTATDDGTARLWSAADGMPIGQPMTQLDTVGTVAFSPDGKTILTHSFDGRTDGGARVRLWSAADGTPIGPPMTQLDGLNAAAFSPDGKAIGTGGLGTARLWSAADGTPIGPPLMQQGRIIAVAFSPDGKAIVTGSDSNTLRLWRTARGMRIGQPLTHRTTVRAVAFTPAGKTIVTASGAIAQLWSAADGTPIGPP